MTTELITPSCPSVVGDRDPQTGRFMPGNRCGGSIPHGSRLSEYRSALVDAVSADDLREIVVTLVQLAKSGDIDAAKVVLDRCLGKSIQPILAEIETHDSGETATGGVRILLPDNGRDRATFVRLLMEHDPQYLAYLEEKQLESASIPRRQEP